MVVAVAVDAEAGHLTRHLILVQVGVMVAVMLHLVCEVVVVTEETLVLEVPAKLIPVVAEEAVEITIKTVELVGQVWL
jgi:hypothetical protein